MTTGSRLIGSATTPYHEVKTWSGSDGLVLTHYKLIRPAYTSVKYGTVRYKVGRRTYKVTTVVSRVYHTQKFRKSTNRSHCQWNSYTMTSAVHFRSKSTTGSYLSDYSGTSYPVAFSANNDVKLQSKLVNAIRGHSFNAAVSNAQTGLTLRMLESNISRLTRSISALKHGNIAVAARHLLVEHHGGRLDRVRPLVGKDLANAWLELQYGWKPLLQDCHDGAEALAYLMNEPRTSRFTVRVGQPYSEKFDHGDYVSFGEGVSSKQIICELYENLSTPRSLGLLNPLSVAWEILPFSFVADWFIPVGTYLDNYNVIPEIKGRFCTTSKFKFSSVSYGRSGSYTAAKSSNTWTQMTRATSTSLAVARPEFQIAPGSHTGHFWNSLALLTQVVT